MTTQRYRMASGILLATLATAANAVVVTTSASADTMLTEYVGYGGPNSTHGSDTIFDLVRGGIGISGFQSFILVRFDLSAFAGQVVNGASGELRLQLIGANTVPTASVSIRSALVNWSESTASFANFGGTGFNEAAQTGPNLTTRTVTWSGAAQSIPFALPALTIQSWINNPTQNYGLILITPPTTGSDNLFFSSREGTVNPTLRFDVSPIPEPATFSLWGLGIIALLSHRRLTRRTISPVSSAPSAA
jgi:hypothetical protein